MFSGCGSLAIWVLCHIRYATMDYGAYKPQILNPGLEVSQGSMPFSFGASALSTKHSWFQNPRWLIQCKGFQDHFLEFKAAGNKLLVTTAYRNYGS